ncbi:unnamed protein product, partial [Prorocentrum cordatum]
RGPVRAWGRPNPGGAAAAGAAAAGAAAARWPTHPAFDSILSAARDDDADTIQALVRMGCPPSFGNRMGQTALHIGAIWGSTNAVKALIEAKANPNAQNQLRGSGPLHAAAMGRGPVDKRAACVRLLIAARADPQMRDASGETPMDAAGDEPLRDALGAPPLLLHKAAAAKSAKALEQALKQVQQGVVPITLESCSPTGDTALHVAVQHRWHEGVGLLLSAGSLPSAQNNNNQAPLHVAVLKGDHELVKVLLDARADPNTQDMDAERDPRFSSKDFKEDSLDHRAPLHYAAERGNVLIARSLLQARANPNVQDTQRCTALHVCLPLRSPDAQVETGYGVRVSGLQSKAELNGRLASIIGDTNGERWPVLLEGGPEPLLLKTANLQPLALEMSQLLLDSKSDVNLGNRNFGESRGVLHEVALQGDEALVAAVLAARAEVNKQDTKGGLSALHLAARGKHGRVIRLLLEAGADTALTTTAGKTAAELAEKNGAAADVLALLRGGASSGAAEQSDDRPQTLDSLTPEQRAMLFID